MADPKDPKLSGAEVVYYEGDDIDGALARALAPLPENAPSRAPAPAQQPSACGAGSPGDETRGGAVPATATVSRADQETWLKDRQLRTFTAKLGETRILEVKIARVAWVVAGFGWLGFLGMGAYAFSLQKQILNFRFPWMVERVDGAVELVQAAPEMQNGEPTKNALDHQLRQFYTNYFGVSDYHKQAIWSDFKTYFLGGDGPLADRFSRHIKEAAAEMGKTGANLRRVMVRKLELQKKLPIEGKGGGYRYYYTVEYIEQDVDTAEQKILRRATFSSRIVFTVGSNPEELSMDQKKFLAQKNHLNFQPVEFDEPELISTDTQPTPQGAAPTLEEGGLGGEGAAVTTTTTRPNGAIVAPQLPKTK